LKNLERKKKE
jgi:hypothetical protein